eukprot:jgi/Phyca11/502623/fgenesh2_kg.PHYCAscaffold_1_\
MRPRELQDWYRRNRYLHERYCGKRWREEHNVYDQVSVDEALVFLVEIPKTDRVAVPVTTS